MGFLLGNILETILNYKGTPVSSCNGPLARLTLTVAFRCTSKQKFFAG